MFFCFFSSSSSICLLVLLILFSNSSSSSFLFVSLLPGSFRLSKNFCPLKIIVSFLRTFGLNVLFFIEDLVVKEAFSFKLEQLVLSFRCVPLPFGLNAPVEDISFCWKGGGLNEFPLPKIISILPRCGCGGMLWPLRIGSRTDSFIFIPFFWLFLNASSFSEFTKIVFLFIVSWISLFLVDWIAIGSKSNNS